VLRDTVDLMRRGIALGLIFATLIGLGCGRDDETKTVTTGGQVADAKPLSKPEYIAQADAICERLHEERGAVEMEVDDVGADFDQAAVLIDEAAQITEDRFDEIGALPPPKSDREVLVKLFDLANENIALLRSAADAMRNRDLQQARSILDAQAQQNDARFDGIATGYGFKVCDQD
jgi:hypothetical protein